MQKVDFDYELIIADDYSTDGTREIILDYKENYPGLIKLILQKRNVGPGKNWLDLIEAPKSKYIAYFEGDDYWTDPYKLQKQVDFLEANEEYSASGHAAYNSYKVKNNSGITTDKIITIGGGIIPTASIIFRKKYLEILIKKYNYLMKMGDYGLLIFLSLMGKIYYFRNEMSYYRINPSSLTHSKRTLSQEVMVKHNIIANLLRFNYHSSNLFIKHILKKILLLNALFLYRITIHRLNLYFEKQKNS